MNGAVRKNLGELRRVLVAIVLAGGLLLAIAYARASHRQISTSLFVSDGFGYYIYLPSLLNDGDLDFSNQLAYQTGQREQAWYRIVPVTGRPGNTFQVGCAVLWAPFFLLAHGVVLSANAMGARIPATGFGLAYELPVYCGSFAFGLAALVYMQRLMSRLWPSPVANVSAFYTATGTALAAYLWFEPDMSHVVSAFLISAYFYFVYDAYDAGLLVWSAWARIGLLLGLIACVRVPDCLVGVAALAVGVRQCWVLRPRLSAAASCVAACLSGAALGFAPQMAVWTVLYGGPLTRPPEVYENLNWLAPDLINYLFSTRRGVFLWTPLLMFSVAGALCGAWSGPRFLRYTFAVLALALYFNSVIPKWWLGASFSERRLVDYSVLLALGLGFLLSLPAVRRRWYAVHVLGIPLIAFNWLLMLRYFTHDLPEYGDVSGQELFRGTLLFLVKCVNRLAG